ncbi:hypothetical protein ABHD31_08025 [Enterobacter cloacae]|uniref:hypothetical protein n=1 Tax=Enterobacter cloacae TaxID=550 RepID=UPI00325BD3B1
MKTFTIGWLNKCRCGNKSHTVKTARGNESALWDDDAVKCNSCGRGGVIQVCEGQARVLWETDEEMEEGKPMSTITKKQLRERARAKVKSLEFSITQTAFADTRAELEEELELARIALALLEAEPAGYHVIKECGAVGCSVATLKEAEETRDFWNKNWTIKPYFYTAPPAPVVPDDVMAAIQKVARIRLDLNDFDGDKRGILDCLSEAEEALIEVVNRRAAMLQGAEPVTTAYKLPEGWVAVPVDATRAMIDAARRVEEDGYDAMHKAMIAAAPQQEVKTCT